MTSLLDPVALDPAWSPDSHSLVYLQTETYCPPDGKGYISQLYLPGLEQRMFLIAENPNFDNVIWEKPDEL